MTGLRSRDRVAQPIVAHLMYQGNHGLWERAVTSSCHLTGVRRLDSSGRGTREGCSNHCYSTGIKMCYAASYPVGCICRERRWDTESSEPSGGAQCVATAVRCNVIKRCGAEDNHHVQTESDRSPPNHKTRASVNSHRNSPGS